MYNVFVQEVVKMTKNVDNSLKNQVIAMSNTLAEKSTRFTVFQQRLFYVSLASLKLNKNSTKTDEKLEKKERNEVKINKQELFEYLSITNDNNRWTRVRNEFQKLASNSYIHFGDDEEYADGFILCGVRSTKYNIYVRFDTYFLPLVEELADNYVRLLDDDVVSFDSKFSMMLYQNLLKDKWKLKNPDFLGIDYSTRQLKMMFGLDKEVYVNKNGNFNRTLFERKTVNRAVKEINEKSKCIQKLRYEKVKKGNRVQYYLFTFNYTDPQKVVEDARTDKRWEQLSLLDDIPTVEKPVRVPDDVKDYKWWE